MILLRKPLLYLLVLASGASLAGGGRLSLRLLLDTAVALAVVPVVQVAALAVVYWTGRRRMAFPAAVDSYFAGSGPWFAAIAAVGGFGAFAGPVLASQWITRLGAAVFVAAVVLSLRLDFAFFREQLGRTRERAAVDVMVQRAVAWGATIFYLLGMSLPKIGSLVPSLAANLFGARP